MKSRLVTGAVGLAFIAFAGAVIFFAAGRCNLPQVWGVLAVMAVFNVVMAAVTDPELGQERRRPGPGNVDRFTQPFSLLLFLAHWIVAGLDIGRYGWSLIPSEIQIAGLIGFAASLALTLWAMRVNPFYSSAVRVQHERGHKTITAGPYRFVRHPGYTASILAGLCGGTALGSWLGVLPVVVFAVLFVRRTVLEDRLLQRELPGYADYAQQVRYRLIPGVF